MDCPAGTVMSRLYRGRKILQGLLLRLRGRAGNHQSGLEARTSARDERPRAAAAPLGHRPSIAGAVDMAATGARGREETRHELRRSRRASVQAYVDGELDRRRSGGGRAASGRLSQLRAARARSQARFKAAVRAHLPRPEVPFALRAADRRGARVAADRAASLAAWLSLPAPGPGGGGGAADRRDHRHRAPVAVDGARAGAAQLPAPRCRWTSPARTAARSPPGSAAGSTFPCTRRRSAAVRPARAAAWSTSASVRPPTSSTACPTAIASRSWCSTRATRPSRRRERRVVNGREIYLGTRPRHLDRGLPRPWPRLRRHG